MWHRHVHYSPPGPRAEDPGLTARHESGTTTTGTATHRTRFTQPFALLCSPSISRGRDDCLALSALSSLPLPPLPLGPARVNFSALPHSSAPLRSPLTPPPPADMSSRGGEDDDHASLLRSHPAAGAGAGSGSSSPCPSPRAVGGHHHNQHADVEAVGEATVTASPRRSGGVRGLLRHLDRRLSARGSGGRRSQQPPQQLNRSEPSPTSSPQQRERVGEELGDGAPPEWALLLIGCLLGLATGICVAAFNRGVSISLVLLTDWKLDYPLQVESTGVRLIIYRI